MEQGDDETIFHLCAKRHSISSHFSTPKEIVQIITQFGTDVGELREYVRLSDRPKFRLFDDVWVKLTSM